MSSSPAPSRRRSGRRVAVAPAEPKQIVEGFPIGRSRSSSSSRLYLIPEVKSKGKLTALLKAPTASTSKATSPGSPASPNTVQGFKDAILGLFSIRDPTIEIHEKVAVVLKSYDDDALKKLLSQATLKDLLKQSPDQEVFKTILFEYDEYNEPYAEALDVLYQNTVMPMEAMVALTNNLLKVENTPYKITHETLILLVKNLIARKALGPTPKEGISIPDKLKGIQSPERGLALLRGVLITLGKNHPDIYKADERGKTALDYAKRDKEIADVLLGFYSPEAHLALVKKNPKYSVDLRNRVPGMGGAAAKRGRARAAAKSATQRKKTA